jgi:uncharacterized membrane protein
MGKIIKYIIPLLLFIPFLNVKAVDTEDVNYTVDSIYIDADVLENGDLKVKELITLNGTFNGYERNITYTGNTNKFDGSLDSFISSDIYNASGITNFKLGIINSTENVEWSTILKNPTLYEESNSNFDNDKYYTMEEIENGLQFRIYNETISSSTSFYIEYVMEDVVVKHEDYAELQYNFIGEDFDDDIADVEIHVNLPGTSDYFKAWAHGPLNGDVKLENNNSVILTISDLNKNTFVDTRILFDKDLVNVVTNKESNVLSEEKILELEASLADQANDQRRAAALKIGLIKYGNIIFIISLLGSLIYVYFKYDKEYNSVFKEKYNRNFIEDYNVEIVPYIFDKKINQNSFNASVLNLIYKKKISVDVIKGKKDDDYKFTKLSMDELSNSETKIMNILFLDEAQSVTLTEIQKYAKKTSTTGVNAFLKNYELWKKEATKEAELFEFYEDTKKPFIIMGIFWIWFIISILIMLSIDYFASSYIISSILIVISSLYVVALKKRTKKGIEDFAKWKAFKRFLKDFGTFDQKDLPEIYLWDKYLVYATVLGVAKKVSKSMKIKIKDYYDGKNYEFSNIYLNYMLFNAINDSVSQSFKMARTEVARIASSNMASAVGSGGGFSSGGGGGTGGGGGRGF